MSADSAVTDGDVEIESVKLQLFRRTLESIVKATCNDINESVFEECYGKFLNSNPNLKSKIRGCFVEVIQSEMKKVIDDFIKEENINEKFQKLQKIETDSTSKNIAWRPSGNCRDDIHSHDCAEMLQLKAELKTLVETEEMETEKLREQVQSARKELYNLRKNLLLFKNVTIKTVSLNKHIIKQQKEVIDKLDFVKQFDI